MAIRIKERNGGSLHGILRATLPFAAGGLAVGALLALLFYVWLG